MSFSSRRLGCKVEHSDFCHFASSRLWTVSDALSRGHYDDLPLLPPKSELEAEAVLRKAVAGNKVLAVMKGADLIPNQRVLIHAMGLREEKLLSKRRGCISWMADAANL